MGDPMGGRVSQMEGSTAERKASAQMMFAKAQQMAKARLGHAPEAIVLGDHHKGRGCVPLPGTFVGGAPKQKDKKLEKILKGPPSGPTVSSRLAAAPGPISIPARSEAEKKKDKKKEKKGKKDKDGKKAKGDKKDKKKKSKISDCDSSSSIISLDPTQPQRKHGYKHYTGHFLHPGFGKKNIDLAVHLHTSLSGSWGSTTGQWAIMGDLVDSIVKIKHEGKHIKLTDGSLKLDGQANSNGALIGEVVMQGSRGGSFVLNPCKPNGKLVDAPREEDLPVDPWPRSPSPMHVDAVADASGNPLAAQSDDEDLAIIGDNMAVDGDGETALLQESPFPLASPAADVDEDLVPPAKRHKVDTPPAAVTAQSTLVKEALAKEAPASQFLDFQAPALQVPAPLAQGATPAASSRGGDDKAHDRSSFAPPRGGEDLSKSSGPKMMKCLCGASEKVSGSKSAFIACRLCSCLSHKECVEPTLQRIAPADYVCAPCRLEQVDDFHGIVGEGLLGHTYASSSSTFSFKFTAQVQQWRKQNYEVHMRSVHLSSSDVGGLAWPHRVQGKLNGRQCLSIDPPKHLHVRRETCYNLTPLLKQGLNHFELKFTGKSDKAKGERDQRYCVGAVLTAASSSQSIFKDVKSQSIETVDSGRQRIKRLLEQVANKEQKNVDECEVTGSFGRVMKPLCPISMCPIEDAAIGRSCNHVQVFDLNSYVMVNQRMRSLEKRWTCPVCSTHVRPQDVLLDPFAQGILDKFKGQEDTIEAIVFNEDCTWTTISAEKDEDANDNDAEQVDLSD